jgi:hypothetical protein
VNEPQALKPLQVLRYLGGNFGTTGIETFARIFVKRTAALTNPFRKLAVL